MFYLLTQLPYKLPTCSHRFMHLLIVILLVSLTGNPEVPSSNPRRGIMFFFTFLSLLSLLSFSSFSSFFLFFLFSPFFFASIFLFFHDCDGVYCTG